MLHHHGGAGSPPYMAPGTAPFSPTPTGPAVSVTADIPPAAPPTTMQLQPTGPPSANFEELPAVGSGAASIQDDGMQADFGGASVGAGASGSGGHHRWPREETLALIRIRTEMDADFRNAPLKAPLWEDVARKLAGLGYHRSAKKCKEKFENVDKYYKRTKDARAGRQDGKSYRFFSQLEALHAAAPQQQPQLLPPLLPGMTMTTLQAGPHQPIAMAWTTAGPTPLGPPAAGAGLPDLSFSSMSGSESDSDSYSDDYDDSDDAAGEEQGLGTGRGGECDREMMAIFEGMMKQVTEKQDAMQRVFLATLERWEAERTAREEAWRRQEVARMNREREQLARERAAAASRDAALIAFLQRVGGGGQQGQPVRLPPHTAGAVPAPPIPAHTAPSPRHDAAATFSLQQLVAPAPLAAAEAYACAGAGEGGSGSTPSSSRWPKEEVDALIQMRNEKDEQYHDVGAKGPLWEDIAAGMRRIGYNRSAKRCKEKWENINKYYKKVKESNKRRPEDSKTCPYFHQLDAMYRKKHRAGAAGGRGSSRTAPGASMATAVNIAAVAVAAAVEDNPSQRELEGKSSNDVGIRKNDEQGNVQASPGNGGTAPATTPPPGDGAKNKTAEDNANETNVQHQQQQFSADETDSDDDDINTVYTEEGNDENKMKYKMGVEKPDVIVTSGDVPAPPPSPPPPPPPAATVAAPTTTSSAAPTGSTFLAVQ